MSARKQTVKTGIATEKKPVITKVEKQERQRKKAAIQEAELFSLPAEKLREYFFLYSPFETSGDEDNDYEQADDENAMDNVDFEDFELDPDGDPTEPDNGYDLNNPLASVGIDTPSKRNKDDSYADVIVEIIKTQNNNDTLRFYSGISNLLFLEEKSSEELLAKYLTGLKNRIRATMIIAEEIVNVNYKFFLSGEQKDLILMQTGNILEKMEKHLKRKKSTLSRLLSKSSLLTPWGERLNMRDFFVERSSGFKTDKALILAYALRYDIESEKPMSDQKLTDIVNIINKDEITGNKSYNITRQRISKQRKSLGLPEQKKRKHYYKSGKSLIDSVVEGEENIMVRRQKLYRLKELLDSIIKDKKFESENAWKIIEKWLEDVNFHLKGGADNA